MLTAAKKLKDIMGLETDPVAVFLPPAGSPDPAFDAFKRAQGHRFCQLLMRARRGESVRLSAEDIACPAAAAAFGFKSLPEGLATGKGLVGFGIVSDPATGRSMFEGMTRLSPGSISTVAACPLGAARAVPDVVVVEGLPEQLMWLLLADVNLAAGARRTGDTAVLQATCVDSTIIPYREQRLNFSLGCYGCREATDLGPTETVLGFPGAMLAPLVAAIERLADRAIARSREKRPYQRLSRTGASKPPAAEPPAEARHAMPGVLPQLEADMVLTFPPEDVMSVFQIVIDGDRDEALGFVRDRLHRSIRKVLERPRCSVAFEMERKLSGES